MAIKSQEVSFITSFPSQLPIYRWKREMAKGFLLQGDPFAPPQSPTSAQMVVRKHRKVWRTDKSFQCYRSKIICNKICQAPEIHSVSWGVCDMRVLISQLTVVRLHRNGTVLCSGMSPKQKATLALHNMKSGALAWDVTYFVSETWCKDPTIWQAHSVTYVII